jgi:hypothetical protein
MVSGITGFLMRWPSLQNCAIFPQAHAHFVRLARSHAAVFQPGLSLCERHL